MKRQRPAPVVQGMIVLLCVAVLALCANLAWDHVARRDARPAQHAVAQAAAPVSCDGEVPPAGTDRKALIVAQHALSSPLQIENRLPHSLLLRIVEAGSGVLHSTLLLYPETAVSTSLPVGEYRVSAQRGQVWCNFEAGFDDGVLVVRDAVVAVLPGSASRMQLKAMGEGAHEVMLSHAQEYGPAIREGAARVRPGVLELVRRRGHYFVEGSVNGQNLEFMVDTGASITSIPESLYRAAAIPGCIKGRSSTANGMVDTCGGTAALLSFGPFRLQDVAVSTNPGLGDPLLGMNVLSHFHLEQKGDVLRISAHPGE